VVPCPAVASLPGTSSRRAFLIRFSSRSMIPDSGGLRSSSAELIASTAP
jgi:shikimate kinase